jgi:hypothetical protein
VALPVYSSRLIRYTGTDTPPYTVGGGLVVVVRQLTYVVNGSLGTVSAAFALPPGEAFFYATVGANTVNYVQWQGRVVINPGESFAMHSSSPAAMTAHGYVLTSP